MLTARNVLIVVVVVAVVSLIGAVYSLLQPPGQDGLGDDTYGTRAHGQRALFETLEELDVPVDRVLIPPTQVLDRQITLVLWGPHPKLVKIEPVYLRRISEWVRDGGRVVVAPGYRGGLMSFLASTEDDEEEESPPEPDLVLEELGLENVSVAEAVVGGEVDEPTFQYEPDSFRGMLERARAERIAATTTVEIDVEGDFEETESLASTVEVPADDLQVLETEGTNPAGRLLIRDSGGEEYPLAARYPHGSGEFIVVSDPRVFENLLIAREDNAVLAYHLLTAPGRTVVFDEFYHGLTIRGNPLYLVARFPFGLITLAILLAIGVWIWRRGVALGPPLEARFPSRRTVTEYVDAMARLFRRGRRSRRFLLQEFRDGALWTLRSELGLPPGRDDPDEIAAVLARRDPQAARELREAVAALDAILSGQRRQNEQQTIQALQRVSACL